MCELKGGVWLLGKATGAARLCAEQRAHFAPEPAVKLRSRTHYL